jgi:hypothetical protein
MGRRAGVVGLLLAVAASTSAVGSLSALHAQTEGETAEEDTNAVLTPLAVSTVAPTSPVRASDGRDHVVYELFIVNQSSATVDITSIDVVDPADDDAVLARYDSGALGTMVAVDSGGEGLTFGPGSSGYFFGDLTLEAGATVPKQIEHHFTLSATSQGDAATAIEFTGVPIRIGRRPAVVVAPPLRGRGWVVGNGCCVPATAHRAATLSINGTVHVAERYAIDFVQLGANDALAQGDPTKAADYGYFGDDVTAAASGTVVNTQDGLPEQTPGALPPGQTVQTAGGNYVVVDIGRGRYAFYAHFQPGTLTVKVGDKVETGDVLGKLGNTGNTDAPHLHFHVMDGPSPLLSNGVPFVFTSFEGEGRVTDEVALNAGRATPVDRAALTGSHRREYPLNLEVIAFPV